MFGSTLRSGGLGVMLMATLAQAAGPLAAAEEEACIVADVSLDDVPLGAALGKGQPELANDRNISLGGFSDLHRRADDPAGVFWIVTDRGPNGTVKVGGKKQRTFPAPDFAPAILKVQVDGDRLTLLEAIPLVGRSGRPIGGLPNLSAQEGAGLDFSVQKELPCSPNGVDSEGLVRMADGSFWVAEEYRPSILKVDSAGQVLRRLIPHGSTLSDTGAAVDYDVADTLPAVYAIRQDNRGFEALALAPDEKTLYAAMQSPLANPTEKAGEKSRNTRILAIDTTTEAPVAEYVYQFDVAGDFAPGAKPKDMKIGAIAMVGPDRLLVLERDDRVAKIYLASLSSATDILPPGDQTDRAGDALETVSDLAAAGIKPLPKTLVADLSRLPMPEKLEGMTIVDERTIAIVNDNDFGFSGFGDDGIAIPTGVKSRLILVRLSKPIE